MFAWGVELRKIKKPKIEKDGMSGGANLENFGLGEPNYNIDTSIKKNSKHTHPSIFINLNDYTQVS